MTIHQIIDLHLGRKNWVEINDDARGMYKTIIQTKFETLMLKLSLSDYSDAYVLVSWTISVADTSSGNIQKLFSIYWLNKRNKQHKSR